MINAYFDRDMGRDGLITGAYQYDTGQRLRLSGLPSPDEMAEMDEFLSGDLVTVAVHYSRVGETQTEPTLATYDETRGVWLAAVPDEYLTRHVKVQVLVHVYWGSDGEQERGKTMYSGSFVPISRPAPNNVVSDDQLDTWATLEEEVQLALTPLNTATDRATDAATDASEAADYANGCAENADSATDAATDALQTLLMETGTFGYVTIVTTALPSGSAATAEKNGNTITLGIPRGADGATGAKGPTGPSDLTFSMSGTTLTITTK